MKNIIYINHHLYQEGDTYGLIYALLLSISERVGDAELHALFYVDGGRFETDVAYKAQVERRFGYFHSFGLLGSRVKVVFCHFNPDPYVMAFKVQTLGPWSLDLRCNGKLFRNNPRRVSLALTGQENDVSKERLALLEQLFEEDIVKFTSALRQLFKAEQRVVRGTEQPEQVEFAFRYISHSTDYVLRCVKTVGFERVTDALIASVLGATRKYTADNQVFLDRFSQALFQRKLGVPVPGQKPLIVLFWIRSAKKDEAAAIASREAGTSPGKPQHHTNLTLYKQARALVRQVGNSLRRRILFVPIGDELREELVDGSYKMGEQDHNLILFFKRPEFEGKPMGAQINFLTLMALHYPVLQIGMRSGSMERLMYLGVPTIYFDRTENEPDLPAPVGATRIRQLCGQQGRKPIELTDYLLRMLDYLRGSEAWKRGYPFFFHIESRDTGFMRYSTTSDTTIEGMISKLVNGLPSRGDDDLRDNYNRFKAEQAAKLPASFSSDCRRRFAALGGLSEPEAERMALMIWFIDQTYPNYASRRSLRPEQVVKIRLDDFGAPLIARKRALEQAISQKRLARASKQPAPDFDFGEGGLFGTD